MTPTPEPVEATPRTEAARIDNADFSDWGTGKSPYVLAEDMATLERELSAALGRIAELERERDAIQAKLDSVMLEYCPDEMTAEQIENWGKNQRAVPRDPKRDEAMREAARKESP